MERITYRKTLDVHKNGTQFVLRGFETSEKLSRIVEISLMASGDAIDFPLENIMALMYISSPGSELPTIKECEIKDNKIICEVSPLVTEGISTIQISLMETSPSGASSVLYTPKFNIEVTKSIVNDTALEQNSDFGILKNAISAAKTVYDQRFLRMELTDDCIFKAYYADGSWYETDILKKLFHNGNVLLSESFAHGNTGTRIGEDTDNAKYYSNLAKSEALNAKEILEESEGVLDEVRKQGVYTAFDLDFDTGEIEYVSPSFSFFVNTDTGKLDAIGQSYSFSEEIYRLITMWLAQNGVVLSDLEKISTTHTELLTNLGALVDAHSESIGNHESTLLENSNDLREIKPLTAKLDQIVTDWLTGTVLWTNPSPTSEFASQTIELNLSEYKRIVVVSDQYEGRVVCYEKDTTYMLWGYYSDGCVGRTVHFNDSGVSIGSFSSGMAVNNSKLIPQKIIGYKY